MYGVQRGQKRALDLQELELEIVVRYHVGPGLNLDPLGEQSVLLTTEPLFSPKNFKSDLCCQIKEKISSISDILKSKKLKIRIYN